MCSADCAWFFINVVSRPRHRASKLSEPSISGLQHASGQSDYWALLRACLVSFLAAVRLCEWPSVNFASQCPVVAAARNGHGPMSDLSPLSGEERKSNFGAVRSVDDPNATSSALSTALSQQPSLVGQKHGPDHPIIGRLRLAASSQL
jgi:hypothetical protein